MLNDEFGYSATRPKAYLRSLARYFGLLALVPMLLGIIGAYSTGAVLLTLLIGTPLLLGALVVGLVRYFLKSLGSAKLVSSPIAKGLLWTSSPALTLAVTLAALPLLWTGSYLGDLSRLAINIGAYERIIAQAQRDHRERWFAEANGITFLVDHGPPVRVAFNPEGILDNWSGIIFDPTEEMMRADGFDPVTGKFRAPDRITKLFGGDLVSCRSLWDDYYTCSFT